MSRPAGSALPRAVLPAALLLVLSGCQASLSPAPDLDVYSAAAACRESYRMLHRIHLARDLGCTECHSRILETSPDAYQTRPTRDRCVVCHSPDTPLRADCLSCHGRWTGRTAEGKGERSGR